jgi:glycine betaine/proline transport system permease protein
MKENAGGPTVDEDALIDAFVGPHAAYYRRAFHAQQNARGYVPSFNLAAAAFGPLWAGARGIWTLFCASAAAETVALVLVCRGLFGDLGSAERARAAQLADIVASRLAEAKEALAAGDTARAELAQRLAGNLQKAADQSLQLAADAAAGARMTLIVGLVAFLAVRVVQGAVANALYERRYSAWRGDRSVPSGVKPANVALALFLVAVLMPLTIYRFTASSPAVFVTAFPADKGLFSSVAKSLDAGFDSIYKANSTMFDGVRDAIRLLVDGFELALVFTPWPVVMIVTVVLAWRISGYRVGIFTAASLAYLGFLGLWTPAMQTVALLGTASLLSIVIGIPLGIWFSRSEVAYGTARPVLDFMQTMPAFVYLIPVIAFFGTGKPPGVIATIIFGMPPVVRLTALGLKQVPEDIKEAARAYGASEWQLLTGVELPLALSSIMTGVNQTILMCLSMVVIASLIGAQGLGSIVLESLQYAAKGQGLLAGLAILLCAMILDRIVQGGFKRN